MRPAAVARHPLGPQALDLIRQPPDLIASVGAP